MKRKNMLVSPLEAINIASNINYDEFLDALRVADAVRLFNPYQVLPSDDETMRGAEIWAVYTAGKVQGIRQERKRKTKGTVQN